MSTKVKYKRKGDIFVSESVIDNNDEKILNEHYGNQGLEFTGVKGGEVRRSAKRG